MKTFQVRARGLSATVSAVALVISASAYAQDTQTQPDGTIRDQPADSSNPAEVERTDADGTVDEGGIVVTGSRVKKTGVYESISPLQVLTAEDARDVGQFDPAQVLQRSESAAGQQIDATFGGFVLNNGPGSQTINLRGLGADRTLLLINGRRMAPAGVEGAPTNPSINLIPGSLVARYDLLLDGASSVYGSDAVAGVGNIILRKDFDRLELNVEGNVNPNDGGNDYTISAAWGKKFDNGFFGIGGELAYRDAVQFRDRPFLANCDTNYEITNTGEIRTVDLLTNALVRARTPGVRTSEGPCKTVNLTGRIFIEATNYGSVYFTGGAGNTFIPGFSENTLLGRDLDVNGDGLRDVDFQKQNADNDGSVVLINQQKVYNLMAYGEYSLGGAANITPFFEANYTRSEVFADNSGAGQLFPYVPANNAFNPCNFQTNPNGVDCRRAENMRRAASNLGGAPLSTGFILPVEPIVAVRGDRNGIDVVQEQMRFVGGVKGDLPFIAPSWSFEVAGVYSRAKGTSNRRGIREDKLALALGIDPTADFDGDGVADNDGDGIADDYQIIPIGGVFGGPVITPCTGTLANPNLAMADLKTGCVPVNLFTPSLISVPIGDFATQAERDYLFGDRRFKTTYTQILANAYVTGNLFKIPFGGDVAVVLGGEYREDKINSLPDQTASNGLLFAFFTDLGAVGKKHVKEVFGELDIPLLVDLPFTQELRLNLSGRITDDQYYGTAETYSAKAGWRPIEQLLFKASYGTSFRAPNLRENFLRGQSGFLTLIDPCAIPSNAFVGNTYRPDLDTREATTLANCRREGRDPTRIGISTTGTQVFQSTSVEIARVGSLELDPETSRSLTAGASFEETLGDGWSISLSGTYYDIKIDESIVEPGTQFAVDDCFKRQDGVRSEFCDSLFPGKAAADLGLLTSADLPFFNIDTNTVRGLDFNADFGKEIGLFGRRVRLGLNLRANHLIERSTLFIDASGVENFSDFAGEFGLPKWTGRGTFTAEVDNWTFTWQTRYLGDMRQDPVGVDRLSDAFGFGPDGLTAGVVGNTCLGGGSRSGTPATPNGIVPGDGVYCRDIGYARQYFEHAASIRYRTDRWEMRVGVTNIFDRNPPNVDPSEVLSISNVPIGAGYNLDGREFFASARFRF